MGSLLLNTCILTARLLMGEEIHFCVCFITQLMEVIRYFQMFCDGPTWNKTLRHRAFRVGR